MTDSHSLSSANQSWRWPDTRRPYGSCAAVARLLKAEHCNSCHDDMDEGYDACEISTRKGVVEVCCPVARAWTESGRNG